MAPPKRPSLNRRLQRLIGVALILLCMLTCTYLIFSQLNTMHLPTDSEAVFSQQEKSSSFMVGKRNVASTDPKEELPVTTETVVLPEKRVSETSLRSHELVRSQTSAVDLGLDTVLLVICSNRPQYLQVPTMLLDCYTHFTATF